jgi:acetyl esterase/lipase
MPLDQESEALLAARRKTEIESTASRNVAEIRASRKGWQTSLPVLAAPVYRLADLDVPVAGGTIKARLYWPSQAHRLPVVLYFHGGGWVLGDLEHSDALCRALCISTGAVVVNVDYRLAPEHKYPVAAEDCYAALGWVVREARCLDIDPARLAVAGASAGGNLAAAVTLMSRDRAGPPLRAQLLVYPCLDDVCDAPSYREFAEGFIVSTEDMRWYWRQYLRRAADAAEPYACPLLAADLSRLPPALVITAECDPIRDDGEAYAERLRAAGVAVSASRYPGTLHGFFAMPGALAKADAAIAEAAAFLRRALADGESR